MLCAVDTQRFTEEATCPVGTLCKQGVCAATRFGERDGGVSRDATVAIDVGVEPDAGTDTVLDSAMEVDAYSRPDAVADAVMDSVTGADSGSRTDTAIDTEVVGEAAQGHDVGVEADSAADTDAAAPTDVTTDARTKAFTPSSHHLAYDKVGNLIAKDDLLRVRWHPSGAFALVLGTDGQVLRYSAATRKLLPEVLTLPGSGVDLDVDPSGHFFVVVGFVVGQDDRREGRLWRLDVGSDDAVTLGATTPLPFGLGVAAVPAPGGGRWVIATRKAQGQSGFYVDRLTLWTRTGGLGDSQTWSGIGISDAMWADVSTYDGSEAIVTSQGIDGADSESWVLTSDAMLANQWSPGFGNPGRAGWRPGGSWGMLAGWSSNQLYAFDGAWHEVTIAGVPNGIGPQTVSWNADGTRALIVGRVYGTPLRATVIDYRPLGQRGIVTDPDAFVDVSIPNFGQPPWSGNSNMYLLDADWRPATACAEGLVVGSDNSQQPFSPSYGLIARFHDVDDPACASP